MSHLVLSLGLVALTSSLVPAAAQSTDATPIDSGRPVPVDPDLEPGALVEKPDGSGLFIADDHHGGGAAELHLVQLSWGRLVDVLALDANGRIDPRPVMRDYAIAETVQSDTARWVLADQLGTQRQRLLILRTLGAPEPSPGAGTFEELLADAADSLVPIEPRGEGSPPPFSSVPRNAALVAHFDDLLRDSSSAVASLADNVRVQAGLPGGFPFGARVLFDPNHGGILRGKFHSTRVLVDLTVSEFELRDAATPLPVNALGLPAGDGANAARASLHIPTRIDPSIGQFSILTNFAGRGLPINPAPSPFGSTDFVRAFGVAGEDDAYNGFLLDLQRPSLVGDLPATVHGAALDPAGEPGFAFLVDWTYAPGCALRPLQGSVLLVGEHVLEVVANASLGAGGTVTDARVRLAGHMPTSASEILGSASVLHRLRASSLEQVCWVSFTPQAATPPGAGVDPSARIRARFSEALDASTVKPHDSLRIVELPGPPLPDAYTIVAGEVLSSAGLDEFSLVPILPLAHFQGDATRYRIEVLGGADGVRDLAGNPIALALPAAEFTIEPDAATEATGSVVMRFTDLDELAPLGVDVRGSFLFTPGRLLARPLAFTSVPVDPLTNPVPAIMIPFAPGVQTPLSPLGSKLHSVWRYCDLGWSVRDETKYDVDVAGLAWAPVGGNVIADFYERFEIRLAHSRFLPDESLDNNLLPKYTDSGLHGPYSLNVLEDPLSPQKVVHPRDLGYVINPADLFVGDSGRTLMPYPLNQGSAPFQSYTWRDTRVQATGGPNGVGVPLDIESGAPLFLEPDHGTLAGAGDVPSIGLPLLMEFRCYPSDTGLGLNSLGTLLAINSSALPAFRAYSTGGFNSSGLPVVKNPDNEGDPSGSFNPSSTPPGEPTSPFDNVFYVGQLDLVTRVSRVITAWIDTRTSSPDFAALVTEPLYGSSGGALPLTVEVRGADSVTGGSPFDASQMNAYGELPGDVVLFHGGDSSWHDAIDAIDGARFVQLRITLTSDVESGFRPSLDGLAIAFLE